jgi:ferredoxin
MIKSALIITFSGTGNTQFVVDALVNILIEHEIAATTVPLEKLLHHPKYQELMAADLIGIAFPVHAFNPPPLVEKIIQQLPQTTARNCFILKTSGSPFAMGGTTSRLKGILKKRRWNLKYEVLVPMPSNFVARYPDSFMKLNAEMALKQVEQIAQELLNEDWKTIPASRLATIICILLRMERIGAVFYGHYLKVEKSCIKCGRCVRDCPTKNIKCQEGKFSFGWKCTLCMRCSFFCPVQAFNHKHVGRFTMSKPPFNLQQLLDNPTIKPADMMDDKISNMKDFRQFWFRAGIL